MLRRFEPVMKGRVFVLQVSGVRQQDAAQIDGGWRRVNRAMEALLHQARYPAGVIEVRVSQDDGVNFAGGNWQVLPIAFAPFLLPLKEPTVHQHLNATFAAVIAGIDQVLRSGNNSRCSQKLDVTQAGLFRALVARLRSTTFVAFNPAGWQVPGV